MIEKQPDEIAQLMDLVFQQRLSFNQKLVQEEATLRHALVRLGNADFANTSCKTEHHGMRAVGADLLWQAWLTRHKIEMNTRLANVLARKEISSTALRKAFGRSQAADAIRDQFQVEAKLNRQRRDNAN
ncbi:hypothetical protein K7H22_03400 [Seohaeicola saemankumensis]|uniref:hypothetical protein n=1 Tax=Seohaeicola saemankumensis TaxID=481181 RepID=UPI001E5F5537|nr:hypothetical protein [Seohaeicola saemankumensis]MCD1625037.1 hypothetical protein [Seohaeicola saemankumensis]